MSLVIDAHQHFWQLGRFKYDWLNAAALAKIRRDYLPQDLEPLLRASGVDRTIFVQTQHDLAENRWVLDLADEHAFLAGIVGWVDLASPECEAQLLEFKRNPKFVGVRHVTHDEADDDFIVRPEILRGLKVLEKHEVPFDLLFFVKHLRHVPAIVAACPELRLVIDHLAKPMIKAGRKDGWLEDFRRAAQFPTVYCKLSGMVTEADWNGWTPDDLRPYIEAAVEFFGPQRLMYGSDWPVCELAGSYAEVRSALAEAIAPLSQAERDAIWGQTATDFYRLPAQKASPTEL